MKTFLATGILGGFTTFSAFSLDTAVLIERGDMMNAAAYVLASVLGSIMALFAGLWLVRMVAA
jgi:CrcB protein